MDWDKLLQSTLAKVGKVASTIGAPPQVQRIQEFAQSPQRQQAVADMAGSFANKISNSPLGNYARQTPLISTPKPFGFNTPQQNSFSPSIADYTQGRIVRPAVNAYQEALKAFNPQLSASQRVISTVNSALNASQLSPQTQVAMAPYNVYEGLKASMAAQRQKQSPTTAFAQGLAGNDYVGLGDAATNNPLLAGILNTSEIPAMLLGTKGKSILKQRGLAKATAPVKDATRQIEENSDQLINIFMRYDGQLGELAPRGGVNKIDLNLYPDAVNMWKKVFGAKNNPPKNIGQIVGELREAMNGARTEMAMRREGIQLGIVGKNNSLSSEGVLKKGKLNTYDLPTQTEIKNRAEINAGNPDLYDQRKVKLNDVYGNNEPLPWESNIKLNQPKKTSQPIAAQLKQTQNARPVIDRAGQVVDTSIDDIVRTSGMDLKNKLNIFDNFFRTPDRVLSKIGLGNEANQIRQSYDNYIKELPVEINKVTEWSKRVSPEGNVRIFRYLDGQGGTLSPEEMQVATEIRQYLKGWADKLKLPQEKRITNYITHIFDRDFKEKEIDPDLAKIIREKVAGSVYDPFTEKRLGALGYKEDTWAALDAYVKRATRKVNMDPILNTISQKADGMEESQFNYVKNYIARVNMQPTKIDNLIDNTIKQVIGYKLGARPTTVISRALRQAGFRGALGLNVGSALRNLTQVSNTYAKLGEKYTTLGYMKMLTNGKDELEREGILRNDFVQDRTINATKKFWEKMDKGLFALFETAERINRGSAYFGAKSQALAKGLNEKQAIDYAKKIVRDTQFSFGSIDNPGILSSDIGKTFGQFQSYNLKQAEFLSEMVKNKEFKGLARYTISSLVIASTIGKMLNIDIQNAIPFYGVWTGDTKLGQTPAINAGIKIKNAVFDGQDQYGNELDPTDRAKAVADAIIPLVPGGVQLKKSWDGFTAVDQGYSESKKGRIQFPIEQSPSNYVRGVLFGKSNLDEAQQYYDNNRTPLSDTQSEALRQANPNDRQSLYDQLMGKRSMDKTIDETKKSLKAGEAKTIGNTIVYFDDTSGDVKTINLAEFKKIPTDSIARAKLETKKYSTAETIMNSPLENKAELISSLGLKPEDVSYYSVANQENYLKSIYVKEQINAQLASSSDRQELFNKLSQMRKLTVNNKEILSDGVISDLVDEGYITKEEGAVLKKFSYSDKDGKVKVKMTGRGGGAKVRKIKTIPMNISTRSSSPLNQSMEGIASLTPQQIQMPNVNFSVPNFSTGNDLSIPKFRVKFNL